ncbi:MAG: hypothetical protein ABI550_05300 [Ignavibacteriaceae bacterium]
MLNKNTLLKYLLIILFLSSVSLSANNNSINLENPIKDDLHLIKEKSYSIQPGKEINVDASFGDVLITTWDKSEVYIKILGNEKAEK